MNRTYSAICPDCGAIQTGPGQFTKGQCKRCYLRIYNSQRRAAYPAEYAAAKATRAALPASIATTPTVCSHCGDEKSWKYYRKYGGVCRACYQYANTQGILPPDYVLADRASGKRTRAVRCECGRPATHRNVKAGQYTYHLCDEHYRMEMAQ